MVTKCECELLKLCTNCFHFAIPFAAPQQRRLQLLEGEILPFIVIICISLFCHLRLSLIHSACCLFFFFFIFISVFFIVIVSSLFLFPFSRARQKSTQFRKLLNTRMFYSSSYRKDLRIVPIVVVVVVAVTVGQRERD